jgi:hypothetical protein
VRLRDPAVLVDDVRDPSREGIRRRVGRGVRDADLPIGVAQQREGKVELFGEAAILLDTVEADADDLRVLGLVLEVEVPEPGTFPRSTGCVGLRIKPEHDFLAPQVGKLDAIPLMIDGIEFRSSSTNLEHARFSSEKSFDDADERHARYCSRVTLDEWNARYRAREEIVSDPAPLLVEAVRDLAPGRALDLACGAGRNAVWLSRQGWEVIAIDGAEEAIRLVHPDIDARVMDLTTGAPLPFEDESFDLVAILFFLHRPLFAEARRVLKRGGVIVCTALMRGTYRIAPGELARTFADYTIVRASEGELAELIARK